MAKTSGTKLTKYISGSTIITAEAANTWYGGLYGTAEGDQYEEGDPLVSGHIHDGKHQDGHAQKVDLVDHVTGELRNLNLELQKKVIWLELRLVWHTQNMVEIYLISKL